ncbi:polyphenol oxidase family protein [Anaerosphaera multitolerans]|uniref:Laccase domain-containing protein n=1 Tax=Anaerosphaera multitolerans TaxID=2487351 RepID=A0A437S7W0_9FIRM|nr:polyphenol oxidase family protein [Anaerosphaera multitolerans]RVU54998.1 laccase domain-containing protein [Anaerosphaera multitolerans]
MNSKLLESMGLKNYIANAKYNFKYENSKDKIKDYMNSFLIEINLKPSIIYTARQIHSNKVAVAEKGEDFIYGKIIFDVDGLLTDKSKTALLIKFADCTPVVLFDAVNKVQVSLHSGWRGTSTKISQVAINKLVKDYGSKRENIFAFIGPTIDSELYEVGSEVYDAFSSFKSRDDFFSRKNEEKFNLNLKAANLSLLLEYGIPMENIEVSKDFTFSNNSFHSARRDGINYGLNAIITMIV